MCHKQFLCVTIESMRTASIREIRAWLTDLDKVLSKEGEIIVTRRGRPLARILPVTPVRSMPSNADLRRKMPRLATGSEVLIRKDRDER